VAADLPLLWQFIALLGAHWIADFLLQTRWMAENKSKRLDALALHVTVYSAGLAVAAVILFGLTMTVALFIAANAVLHFATDFVTSRMTTALWQQKNVYGFFAVVGLDQFLHQIALAATLTLVLLPATSA
jgi:hypothetical protein